MPEVESLRCKEVLNEQFYINKLYTINFIYNLFNPVIVLQ